MRKIRIFEHISLDGVIEQDDGYAYGRGKRLFSENVGARELTLVSTKTTPTGVLLNTYRHVGALRT